MALNLDKLSLWEISFRWHDLDPHQYFDIKDIPLEVKDTLRTLAAEVYSENLYSKLQLRRESSPEPSYRKTSWFTKEIVHLSINDWENEFRDCVNKNVIDTHFLQSVIIPYWELKYWCKEFGVPFPSFWHKPAWLGGKTIPIGNHLYPSRGNNKTESNEAEETNEARINPEPDLSSDPDTSQQREAAYCRHKPVEELKQECIFYWLNHKNYSNNKTAAKFYEELSPEKKRQLIETNAVRTLAQAISDYKNRDRLIEKNELPHWLINFNPENPQT